MTFCSSLYPSHNISGLGDSYTVFQECRLKSDMPGPSKHNRGQKPQRITHNQSPKEFPWTQRLTRKLCTVEEGRRAAATPDLNSTDSSAGDRLKHSALWLVLLLAITEIRLKDIFTCHYTDIYVLIPKGTLNTLCCKLHIPHSNVHIVHTQPGRRMSSGSKAARLAV